MGFHTIKVTGVPDRLLELLDERVRDRQWLGRSEYIRELIRQDVYGPTNRPRATQFQRKEKERASMPSKVYVEVLCRGPLAEAKGAYIDEGIVVHKGSLSRAEFTPSTSKGVVAERDKLVERGILSLEGTRLQYTFTQDHLFTSLSLAASIVLARQANGWLEWRTADRRKLKQLKKKLK